MQTLIWPGMAKPRLSAKTKRQNTVRGSRAVDYFKRQFEQLGLRGRVIAVVVRHKSGQTIGCYGRRINDGSLLRCLNLSIAGGTAHIHYESTGQIITFKKGYFVPADTFAFDSHDRRPVEATDWVALINIAIGPNTENAQPFPRQPLK